MSKTEKAAGKKQSTLKRIHVNQHNIRANAKNGDLVLPVYTIKNRGRTITCDGFTVDGKLESVYSPCKPLACGARVWLESKDPVTIYRNGTTEVLI